jgi:agmatinase
MDQMIAPALDGHTFMKAPRASVGELRPGDIAVVGLPWEGTKVSRLGCRFGPRAIREATYVTGYLLQSLHGGGIVDMETGVVLTPANRHRLVDLGDLGLFHADVHQTMNEIRAGMAIIVERGALPVILGGDHFISYPSIMGVREGLRRSGRPDAVGYVHIDAHMDLLDELPWFGPLSSGSQVRRLIDSGMLDPRTMLMIGIGGALPKVEVDFALSSGIGLLRRHEIQRAKSIAEVVKQALAERVSRCETVYLTIDIDVNDRSFAPGTGAAGAAGGLLPVEFLEVLGVLRDLPLAGVDLVEVAPNLDPSGRTASLAATALMTVLEDKLFDREAGDYAGHALLDWQEALWSVRP